MSFREKSTWITFVLLLVVFGYYFASVAVQVIRPVHPHTNFFMLFLVLLIIIVVMEIVLHAITASRSPADANKPQDERESLIALKAKGPAFFVLMAGAFLSVAVAHLGVGVWALINAMLCAIWLGELTNYGAQLFFYRRET
jgi:Na+/H+ antiporter NhaD/arsenite permease-like protein